jgi:hypothetical protein
MELMDKEQEIVEVRHEATVAAERAWEVEQTMEKVVSELKEEVMSATGNMQGAALAGLGLQVPPPPPPPHTHHISCLCAVCVSQLARENFTSHRCASISVYLRSVSHTVS